MDNIKTTIINECLNTLKRDDVKDQIKDLMRPLVDMIIAQLYPYIFLSIIFVSISFSAPTIQHQTAPACKSTL